MVSTIGLSQVLAPGVIEDDHDYQADDLDDAQDDLDGDQDDLVDDLDGDQDECDPAPSVVAYTVDLSPVLAPSHKKVTLVLIYLTFVRERNLKKCGTSENNQCGLDSTACSKPR